MASNGNPGNRKDPLPVFCFKVTLTGGMDAFFKSVTGLKYETESMPVREGGVNDTTFMLVGATKWSPLVLKNGFTNSSALLQWREEWMGGKKMTRLSGTITQLDTELKAKAEWQFTRGWPTKWELSELDASKSELSIETLEITHEGLKYSKK
jgi:phage tail-like protein